MCFGLSLSLLSRSLLFSRSLSYSPLPSPLGDGAKARLGSTLKKCTPLCIYRPVRMRTKPSRCTTTPLPRPVPGTLATMPLVTTLYLQTPLPRPVPTDMRPSVSLYFFLSLSFSFFLAFSVSLSLSFSLSLFLFFSLFLSLFLSLFFSLSLSLSLFLSRFLSLALFRSLSVCLSLALSRSLSLSFFFSLSLSLSLSLYAVKRVHFGILDIYCGNWGNVG